MERCMAVRKLRYFRYIMRKPGDTLERDIATGQSRGRHWGRSSRSWMKDTFNWTELLTQKLLQTLQDRNSWRKSALSCWLYRLTQCTALHISSARIAGEIGGGGWTPLAHWNDPPSSGKFQSPRGVATTLLAHWWWMVCILLSHVHRQPYTMHPMCTCSDRFWL